MLRVLTIEAYRLVGALYTQGAEEALLEAWHLGRGKLGRSHVLQYAVLQLSGYGATVGRGEYVEHAHEEAALPYAGLHDGTQLVVAHGVVDDLQDGAVGERRVVDAGGIGMCGELPPLPVGVRSGGEMGKERMLGVAHEAHALGLVVKHEGRPEGGGEGDALGIGLMLGHEQYGGTSLELCQQFGRGLLGNENVGRGSRQRVGVCPHVVAVAYTQGWSRELYLELSCMAYEIAQSEAERTARGDLALRQGVRSEAVGKKEVAPVEHLPADERAGQGVLPVVGHHELGAEGLAGEPGALGHLEQQGDIVA